MDNASWAGQIFFGTRRLLYAGPVLPTSPHAHHAHQVVLADPPVALAAEDGDHELARAFFIPAHATHAIASVAARCLILFVEPEDWQGRALTRIAPSAASADAWVRAAQPLSEETWGAIDDWSAAESLARRLLSRLLADGERPTPQHPAVMRAIRKLPGLVERGDVRLATVAQEVGVSPSRLAHLFSAEVGVPMRPYILWLRLQKIATSLSAGTRLTDAAHEAGFADSAHLSRVWRRMFGIAPSQLGQAQWVPPPAPRAYSPP